MAQSVTGVDERASAQISILGKFHHTGRRVYQASLWFLLYLVFQGVTGTAWDVQWHTYVGRDQFWTPPHILIYTAVGCAGLIALVNVLASTLRYHLRTPGVDDTASIRILWLFHAPLGFVFTGFGILTALIAAPFDNYWHELYGIDVTLWSPFHIMGITGGLLAIIGFVYVFASEAALDRQKGTRRPRLCGLSMFEWGSITILALLLELPLMALLQFPSIDIGPVGLVSYPLPLAFFCAFCLRSALAFTGKPGTATLVALLLTLYSLFLQAIIPLGLRILVIHQGLTFRPGLVLPIFNLNAALMPLVVVVSAVIIDAIALWQQKKGDRRWSDATRYGWFMGIILSLPALIIPLCIVSFTTSFADVLLLRAGIILPPGSPALAVLMTFPLTVIVGAVGAILGTRLGEIWRWSTQ